MSYRQDLNRINCSILHSIPLSPILFLNEAFGDWRAPSKWGACHQSSRSGAKSPAQGPWEPFWWGLRQQQAHRPPDHRVHPEEKANKEARERPVKPSAVGRGLWGFSHGQELWKARRMSAHGQNRPTGLGCRVAAGTSLQLQSHPPCGHSCHHRPAGTYGQPSTLLEHDP